MKPPTSAPQDPLCTELGGLCAEVAEIVAATGAYAWADQILGALVEAQLFTHEKATLGRIYMRMLSKQYDLALQHGQDAYAARPGLHKVAFLLAQLFELVGDADAARRWYERSLQADASVDWRATAQTQFLRLEALRRGALQAMDITSAAVRA